MLRTSPMASKLKARSLAYAIGLTLYGVGLPALAQPSALPTDKALPLATVARPVQSSTTLTPGNLLTPDAILPESAMSSSGVAPVASAAAPNKTPVDTGVDQKLSSIGLKPVMLRAPHVAPAKRELTRFQARPQAPASHESERNRVEVRRSHSESRQTGDDLILSNTQLNILRFPEAIKHLWFPANTPIVGKPAYFAGDHAVMLQFQPGMQSKVQLMIELQNGSVISREAELRAVSGAVYNLNGSQGTVSGLTRPQQGTTEPTAPDTDGMSAVRLLQNVVQGMVPAGFSPGTLPAATVFTAFRAQPVMAWQNTTVGLRIYVFQLIATGGPAVATPPEFYRPGIEAVLLTADQVTAKNGPFLYVVEAIHGN